MRTIEKRGSLDWALLGVLDQGPHSGYDLRKTFGTTPLGHFSDSPGAIYPALRRLERDGLIEAVPAEPAGGRGRRPLRLTSAGRRALVTWLRRAPTRDEVEHDMDGVVLRLAFMSQALRDEDVARYLDTLAPLVDEHLASLERFYAAAGGGMTLSARLAFESGVEGVRSCAIWLKRARRRARRQPTRARSR